jgi:hypothetical protein
MPLAGVIYVALLFAVTLAGRGPMLSFNEGLERLNEIYFLPFYYHYYTTESAAMTSLISVTSMFLPIGVMFWVWRVVRMREFVARGAFQAALLTGLTAALVASGKLFFRGSRPDPTDVIIAGAAGVIGFVVMSICTHASLNFASSADDVSSHESS